MGSYFGGKSGRVPKFLLRGERTVPACPPCFNVWRHIWFLIYNYAFIHKLITKKLIRHFLHYNEETRAKVPVDCKIVNDTY